MRRCGRVFLELWDSNTSCYELNERAEGTKLGTVQLFNKVEFAK